MADKIDDGGPAFPHVDPTGHHPQTAFCDGLSIRDYFAAAALQAMTDAGDVFPKQSVPGDVHHTYADLKARSAYAYADAMLRAREVK